MVSNHLQSTNTNYSKILFIPLKFWFCEKPGLSFPLLSIDYDVKINVEFEFLDNLRYIDENEKEFPNILLESHLYIDYVFLETTEKKFFLNNNLSYFIKLIENSKNILQKNVTLSNINLNVGGYIDSLYWTIKKNSNKKTYIYEKIDNCSLYFNEKSCFSDKDGTYLSKIQSYQFMKNIPQKNIHLFSFSLNPPSDQPCGFLNAKNIKKSTLQIKTNKNNDSQVLNIYFLRHNILEIKNRKLTLFFM